MLSDVDPMKHAGEGWGNTDEYAKVSDLSSPYVQADTMFEGDYYPSPKRLPKGVRKDRF